MIHTAAWAGPALSSALTGCRLVHLHLLSGPDLHQNFYLIVFLNTTSACYIRPDQRFVFLPRSGELRTQKLKSHLVRRQSLKVLLLKPGVGQYIAIDATLTARDFFLAYFYPSGTFTCIFFQNLSRFFVCWLWLTPDPV